MTATDLDGAAPTGGGVDPATSPEFTVIRLVAALRASGLHPVLASNHLAEGVLHDVGWALWETMANPTTGTIVGGGYGHALLHVDSGAYQADRLGRRVDLLQGEVDLLKLILFSRPPNFVPSEWPEYATGATSIASQQMVLSPILVGTQFRYYRYPELRTLLNLAQSSGMRVYANVGIANNPVFWTGEYEFNRVYSLKTIRPGSNRLERIAADDFVYEGQFFTPFARFPLEPRDWYHTTYDPTHPDVVDLCLESIRDLARTFPAARLMLSGENQLVFPVCAGEVLDATNCSRCAPITNFSKYSVGGFRSYMRRVEPSALQVNARWQIPSGSAAYITDHSQINIDTTHHCPWYLALRDFQTFQRFLLHEVQRKSYQAAKLTNPSGFYTYLTSHPDGMERGWLESDAAVSLNFYVYERAGDTAFLHTVAAAARLSGKPGSMAISSPAGAGTELILTEHYGRPSGFPFMFGYMETWRATNADFVALFVREVLTLHGFHFSYQKALGFSLRWWPPNMAALRDMLQFLESERTPALRFSGPYQRVAVHHVKGHFGELRETVGPEIIQHLDRERIAFAVFDSARVLRRGLSRDVVRRSFVVVPFHDELHVPVPIDGRTQPLIAHYLDMYRRPGARGSALILARPTDAFLALLPPPAEFRVTTHATHVQIDWLRGPLAILLFPSPTLTTVMSVVRPILAAPILQSVVADPLECVRTTVSGGVAEVRQTFVSDGANLFVAVSRYDRGAQPVNVTVTVDPLVRSRMQAIGTYPPAQTFSLSALGTRFLRLPLQPLARDAGDVAAGVPIVAARFAQVLDSLASQGFDAGTIVGARDLIARARELLISHPGRALAALTAVSRMVFVRAEYVDNRVSVWARYAWRADAGGQPHGVPAVTPVREGRVQILFVENAHEEFDVPNLSSAGAGSFAVPAPREPRWDFRGADFAPSDPRGGRLQVIEVHVFDPVTGAAGSTVVDPWRRVA